MKQSLRQSMASLHTWAGLLVGWVLFFMFLTGTLGYFDTEIDRWMRPELPVGQLQPSQRTGIEIGLERLAAAAPDATQWTLYPPSGRDVYHVSLYWVDDAGEHSETLDHDTGRPLEARATGGGQALYQLHYLLRYLPYGAATWIVGFCSMLMLTVIVSGVITHKRIFRDFFTFRPRKGRRSWLDLHSLFSVLALPFHLMITYSGLVFFVFTYMAFVVSATYGDGPEASSRFFDDAFRNPAVPEAAGVPAPMASLTELAARADALWGEGQIRSIDVRHPGDANARVILTRSHVDPVSNGGRIVFDGVSGALLEHTDRRSGPTAVNDALLGLHEGLFATPVLRWLYFAAGLIGTAMIATGLVLWTAKRRTANAGRAHVGLAPVERLNVGTIIGLPVAIAAYFWANRLLPVTLEGRADLEMNALFVVWLLMLAHAAVRPVHRAWAEQALFASAAFGLLPVVNALTTDIGLAATVPAGDWMLAGVDLTALACGAGFAAAARRLRRLRAGDRARVPAAPEPAGRRLREASQRS